MGPKQSAEDVHKEAVEKEFVLDCSQLAADFDHNGFLVVDKLLTEPELKDVRELSQRLLNGDIDASKHRHDLGSHAGNTKQESITQIMWPSAYCPEVRLSPLYKKLEYIAKSILGDDMAYDFDMIIAKPAHSDAETPWHQDESYWLDMSDKRAVSFWVAMQDVDVNNGCMWFVPESHKKELRLHRKVKEGHHANTCDCSNAEGAPQPISAGGCTGHHGRTLHYTGGNLTDEVRIAYIVNFRPESMIQFERSNAYDHGLSGLDGIIQRST